MKARALLLSLTLYGCDPLRIATQRQEQTTREQGFEARFVQAGPARVHAWVGGEGPPVLLIHGFGGDGLWTWRGQMEALAERHTVIVPDLVWFGRSSSAAPPSLDAQVEAMIGLLDGLGLERADVVGISYGGFVTLELAAAAPERVARVVVVDSPGPFFDAEDQQAMLARFGVQSAEQLFVPADPEALRALLDLAYVDPPWVPRGVLSRMHETMFAPYATAHRALLADLVGRRAEEHALALTAPSLVVWGEQDRVFPAEVGLELAEALGAELVLLPGTAHAPNVENPDAFNAAILGFLSNGAEAGSSPVPLGVGAKSR